MNSLGWHTVVATPPRTIQGLITVWPPVTEVPASSDASLNPWMIRGMTLSRSYKTHTMWFLFWIPGSLLSEKFYIFNPVKPDWTFGQNMQTNFCFFIVSCFKYQASWLIQYDIVIVIDIVIWISYLRKKKNNFIQRPKVSRNMLFGAVANNLYGQKEKLVM